MLRTMDQTEGILKAWKTTCCALVLKHQCECFPLIDIIYPEGLNPAKSKHFVSVFGCLQIILENHAEKPCTIPPH